MTIDIHHVRPGDEALFAHIAEDVFDHPVDRTVLVRFLASPGNVLVVALSEREIVGQVAAMVHRHPDGRPTELYIDEVAVTPVLQRRGIARRMIDRVLEIGRDLGCVEFWVGTEHDNAAARKLYEGYRTKAEPFVMYARKLG